jgi:hypothetical protein
MIYWLVILFVVVGVFLYYYVFSIDSVVLLPISSIHTGVWFRVYSMKHLKLSNIFFFNIFILMIIYDIFIIAHLSFIFFPLILSRLIP